MCSQTIIDGFQHEQPDYWLTFGNPWEIERLMVAYPIKLYGHVSATMEGGKQVFKWNAGEQVCLYSCIPNVYIQASLRLWASRRSGFGHASSFPDVPSMLINTLEFGSASLMTFKTYMWFLHLCN